MAEHRMTVGEYLQIEMVHPVETILEELADRPATRRMKSTCTRYSSTSSGRHTQASVALTYAFIIRQLGTSAPWPEINEAIQKRWPSKSSLDRVKKMAWAHVRGES